MNTTHPPTPSTPGAATRTLSSVAEESRADRGRRLLGHGRGWDARFVVDWEEAPPPPRRGLVEWRLLAGMASRRALPGWTKAVRVGAGGSDLPCATAAARHAGLVE